MKIERTLDQLGLWKAIRGIPGLVAIVILSVTVTLFALSHLQSLAHLPPQVFSRVGVVLGVLLALVGYYLGDFWDSAAFDPLYRAGGHWIDRRTRPLHLFPAGEDLRRYRERAVEVIFPPGHSGEGVYREAKSCASQKPSQWAKIEQPLILSKFVRSLIWPCMLLAGALLVSGFHAYFTNQRGESPGVLVAGIVITLISLLLFVPYFHLRVEHMIRLYEHVANESARSGRRGNA